MKRGKSNGDSVFFFASFCNEDRRGSSLEVCQHDKVFVKCIISWNLGLASGSFVSHLTNAHGVLTVLITDKFFYKFEYFPP